MVRTARFSHDEEFPLDPLDHRDDYDGLDELAPDGPDPVRARSASPPQRSADRAGRRNNPKRSGERRSLAGGDWLRESPARPRTPRDQAAPGEPLPRQDAAKRKDKLEMQKQISIFIRLSDWKLIRREAAELKIPMTELCRRWMRRDLAELRQRGTAPG